MLTPLRQPGVSELRVCRTRTRFLGPPKSPSPAPPREFFWDPLGNIPEIRSNPCKPGQLPMLKTSASGVCVMNSTTRILCAEIDSQAEAPPVNRKDYLILAQGAWLLSGAKSVTPLFGDCHQFSRTTRLQTLALNLEREKWLTVPNEINPPFKDSVSNEPSYSAPESSQPVCANGNVDPLHYRVSNTALNVRGFETARRDMPKTPKVVFISSTSEDLKEHRQAARDAAISAGFLPVMMEYFVASGKKPPLPACLAKVDEAHLVVAIVAHRYGWVPPDQVGSEHKSITWLECEYALDQGKEVLAFLVDKDARWPAELRESYRTSAAIDDGSFTQQLGQEVTRNVAELGKFKEWLNSLGLRKIFASPDDLAGKVEAALRDWKPTRKGKKRASVKRVRREDPRTYLTSLRESSAYIDVRGLQVGSGKAHRFPIEDLYIPLTAAATGGRVRLHESLTNHRLVIVGDPGSGKTTFLRRIAFALSQTLLDKTSRQPKPGWVSRSAHSLSASV